MAIQVVTDIGTALYSVFGNGLLFAAFIIGFFVIAMLVLRVPVPAMLMILLPVLIGFVLNAAATNMIEVPAWVLISIIVFMGFVFAGFLLFLVK